MSGLTWQQRQRRLQAELSHSRQAARVTAAIFTIGSMGSSSYDGCTAETGLPRWRARPVANYRSGEQLRSTTDAFRTFTSRP